MHYSKNAMMRIGIHNEISITMKHLIYQGALSWMTTEDVFLFLTKIFEYREHTMTDLQ